MRPAKPAKWKRPKPAICPLIERPIWALFSCPANVHHVSGEPAPDTQKARKTRRRRGTGPLLLDFWRVSDSGHLAAFSPLGGPAKLAGLAGYKTGHLVY